MMKLTMASTAPELLSELTAKSITSGDVVTIYYDALNGRHVAWHLNVADITSPIIRHTIVADGKTAGDDVHISVAVLPSTTAAVPTLYYRTTGDPAYINTGLHKQQSGGIFLGYIPASVVRAPSVDYYITATDGTNTASFGTAGVPNQFTVV
jgi:hypothetical protein